MWWSPYFGATCCNNIGLDVKKNIYFIVFFNLEINEENTFKHYLVFESVFFLLPLIKKKS